MARVKLVPIVALALVCAATAVAATSPQIAHTSADEVRTGRAATAGDLGSGWTQQASTGTAGLNFCAAVHPEAERHRRGRRRELPHLQVGHGGPGPVAQRASVYDSAKPRRRCGSGGQAEAHGLRLAVARAAEEPRRRRRDQLDEHAEARRDRRRNRRLSDRRDADRQAAAEDVLDAPAARRRGITQLTVSAFRKPPPLKWEIALTKIAARRMGAGGNVA